MNNLKKLLLIFLFIFFLFLAFKYNYLLGSVVVKATSLWLTKVFPSLFIMFILNEIIIKTNALSLLNKLIGPPFNKLFHTSGSSSLAFILSLFSGTPSNAYILKEMLSNMQITLEDANKLIYYTYFPNPLFLYTILRLSFNNFITLKIIITLYLSNVLIGLFVRGKKNNNKIILINNENNNYNLLTIIPKAIKKSMDTLLMILGSIIFYLIISTIFENLLNLSLMGEIILKGILEISTSLNSLPLLNIFSLKKEILAILIISFAGLSIHTQILEILNGTKIKYQNFFKGRLYQILIGTSSYFLISIIMGG